MASRTATQSAGDAAVAKSVELTKQNGAGLPAEIADLLPDLVQTNTLEIESQDINFPRLKISHPSQTFVSDGDMAPFAMYSERNADDSDKIVVFQLPKGHDKPDFESDPDAGLLIYVLAMRKGLSANLIDGRPVPKNTKDATFRSWAYDDPEAPRGQHVDTTYNYVVYAPELEASDVPHRILMTRTSTNTAKAINSDLDAAARRGVPAAAVPFRIWVERRERNDNGQTQRWGIFKARTVAPTRDDVLVASEMTKRINELQANADTRAAVENAIVADDGPSV